MIRATRQNRVGGENRIAPIHKARGAGLNRHSILHYFIGKIIAARCGCPVNIGIEAMGTNQFPIHFPEHGIPDKAYPMRSRPTGEIGIRIVVHGKIGGIRRRANSPARWGLPQGVGAHGSVGGGGIPRTHRQQYCLPVAPPFMHCLGIGDAVWIGGSPCQSAGDAMSVFMRQDTIIKRGIAGGRGERPDIHLHSGI